MTAVPTASASRWRRSLDFLYAAGGQLAALCVLAILILMVYASVGRSLDWRVAWINDVVAWLCAAAAFLGMAYSFRNGDFVRVTLLLEKVSERTRHWMELGCLFVGAVSVGYLAFWANKFTYESYVFNEVAQGRVWTGARAKELGLVDELAASPEQLEAAIAANSLHSTMAMKQFVRRVLDGQGDDDPASLAVFAAAFAGPDFLEGSSAFVGKRKPEFR